MSIYVTTGSVEPAKPPAKTLPLILLIHVVNLDGTELDDLPARKITDSTGTNRVIVA